MAAPDLDPPRASYLMDNASPANSTTLLPKVEQDDYEQQPHPTGKRSFVKRPVFWIGLAAAVVVVVLAVALPVTLIKKNDNTSSSSGASTGDGDSGGGSSGGSSGSGNGGDSPGTSVAITGGDGSKVTMEDGTTFTYENKFGGYCKSLFAWSSGLFWADAECWEGVYDKSDPYNDGAKPNSWTPALNETWTWGKDRAYGVNLGGWFVLEPFITPALFDKYPGAVDEWTFSQAMGDGVLEDHYNTFITEKDFAQIAGAGLNYIRLPIPFWAVDTWPGEPFLERTCWKYILKALGWAKKYGLRVNLDLHTIPGSQNGYNHSGKLGQVDFLYGTMGLANAQRALHYIRIITEFISQPEYTNVVQIFGIVNEALLTEIGRPQLTSWYKEAHDMIRGITGIGEGKGPYISVHDGFEGDMTQWDGFLAGSDRVMLDRHPYTAFSDSSFSDPIATGTGDGAGGVWVAAACAWADESIRLSTTFGVNFAGEWSNGWNDCGVYLKGIPGSSTFGGDCSVWEDASTWDASMKAGVAAFNAAQMDALQDWFFWTWKIGNTTAGKVGSPLWSYQLGLEGGWILKDPREAKGKCAGVTPFPGTYEPWMTGGAGAGTITAVVQEYPPATISGPGVPATDLPVYAASGTVNTLPGPTITGHTVKGWFDAGDTALGPTPIAGCAYPNAWDAQDAAVPTGCTGVATAI
ncbi:putative ectomycorrhiza-upregulated exo-beta-1,3-glucanase GH5 [Hymenopellis radicata]|nr:putative ectomycorrhiza-upregulated exo-beta-1,3-glucanase GH5 [Hymenopellis radicata]